MNDFTYWAVVSIIGVGLTWYFLGSAGAGAIGVICIFGGLMQILEKDLHPDALNAHLQEASQQNEK